MSQETSRADSVSEEVGSLLEWVEHEVATLARAGRPDPSLSGQNQTRKLLTAENSELFVKFLAHMLWVWAELRLDRADRAEESDAT